MNGWMDQSMNEWMDGSMNEWMDQRRQMDQWTDEQTNNG